jgi:hypothetical protein
MDTGRCDSTRNGQGLSSERRASDSWSSFPDWRCASCELLYPDHIPLTGSSSFGVVQEEWLDVAISSGSSPASAPRFDVRRNNIDDKISYTPPSTVPREATRILVSTLSRPPRLSSHAPSNTPSLFCARYGVPPPLAEVGQTLFLDSADARGFPAGTQPQHRPAVPSPGVCHPRQVPHQVGGRGRLTAMERVSSAQSTRRTSARSRYACAVRRWRNLRWWLAGLG